LIRGSLNPLFSISAIGAQVEAWAYKKEMEIYHELCRIGETFANAARDKTPAEGSFTNRTGALNGSIGYAVLKDGIVKKKDLQGNSTGKAAAQELIDELAKKQNEGWVLIGFAGMEYAAAVEALGFDVITGSTPVASELIATLKKELNAEFGLSV